MLLRAALNGCKCGKKRTVAARNRGHCCKKDNAALVVVTALLRAAGGMARSEATRSLAHHPSPRVLVLLGAAFFSRNSMIMPAISLPVAVSIPSRPGVEFTSMTTGP